MLVRITRLLGLNRRMLSKVFQSQSNCLLQLRIVPFTYRLRVLFNHHIRIDAVVLHISHTLRREERHAWRSNMPAIHQHRNRPDADQPAPRPLAHQRPQLWLLEQPWQDRPSRCQNRSASGADYSFIVTVIFRASPPVELIAISPVAFFLMVLNFSPHSTSTSASGVSSSSNPSVSNCRSPSRRYTSR
jgi:hypothetical protein